MEKSDLNDRYPKLYIALFLILALAITIRSLPAWTNAAWGNDFGIYYGITTSILKEQHIFVEYNGWGSSYQYFPVLYMTSIAVHLITGMDIFWLMPKIAPIIGGLTVLIIYCMVSYLFKDRKLALLSSLLLAIAPFHVYQTSHAAPLTMGHFFMLLSIYLFLRCVKGNLSAMVFLIPSTLLLILSHHLSTYFYLISIDAIFLVSLVLKKRVEKRDYALLSYLLLAALSTFSYWSIVAKPVFYNFMPSGFPLAPHQTVILYFTLLLCSFFLITRCESLKNRLFKLVTAHPKMGYKTKIILTFLLIIFFEILFMLFPVPGVKVRINPATIIYSIPIATLFSFGTAGLSLLKRSEEGLLIRWWFIAIFASFIYAVVYRGTSIYPDRHLEYLMVPLSIAIALSFSKYFRECRFLHAMHLSKTKYSIGVSLIGLLMFSNMVVVYPAFDSINAADERITDPCINAIEWLRENVNTSLVIASDHRLSMLLWANGFNFVSDETNLTWTSESWEECKAEIESLNISYILIDDIMKDKVVNVGVGKYYQMSNASYEKFRREPFELVYRNATYSIDGEEISWAEIYYVNWSYVYGRDES